MAGNAAQQEWVGRVLDIGSSTGSGAQGAGLVVWQKAREAAIGRLRQFEAAIGDTRDAEAPDAVVLVQAIIKNITAKPDSPQAVDELERWLQTDDILEEAEEPNPFGIHVDVRAPLLVALAQLRADFGA